MSIEVMSSVWKHSQQRGTALLLLLALADSANDYGECYPGIAYLAKKCRMKERNLQVLLKQLSDSGELKIDRQEGHDTPTGKTNRYTIITPGVLAKPGVQRNAPLSRQGVQNPAQGVQNPVVRGAKECTLPVLTVLDKKRGGVSPVAAALLALRVDGRGITESQAQRALAKVPDLTVEDVAMWAAYLPTCTADSPLGYMLHCLGDGDRRPRSKNPRANGRINGHASSNGLAPPPVRDLAVIAENERLARAELEAEGIPWE